MSRTLVVLAAALALLAVPAREASAQLYRGCDLYACHYVTRTVTGPRVYPQASGALLYETRFEGYSVTTDAIAALGAISFQVSLIVPPVPGAPSGTEMGYLALNGGVPLVGGSMLPWTYFAAGERWERELDVAPYGDPGQALVDYNGGGFSVAMTRVTFAMVPEPSTWALLGTGLLAIGGVTASRRKRTET